jgi:predicted RNA-binding protein with PIN domain
VDGYNVIKQDPDLSQLERRGLETARRALLARLRSHPFLRGDEIIVVFDGDGDRATVEELGSIRVVFSEVNEPADQAILRLADAAPADTPVLVLSEDLEVRREVVERGGTAKRVRRRPRKERRTYDDRWHKEADAEEWPEEEKRSSRKKRSPRRPGGRRPRKPEVNDDEFLW